MLEIASSLLHGMAPIMERLPPQLEVKVSWASAIRHKQATKKNTKQTLDILRYAASRFFWKVPCLLETLRVAKAITAPHHQLSLLAVRGSAINDFCSDVNRTSSTKCKDFMKGMTGDYSYTRVKMGVQDRSKRADSLRFRRSESTLLLHGIKSSMESMDGARSVSDEAQ
ncbi:unnamed protein product, partial [Iphiclides podalirius]